MRLLGFLACLIAISQVVHARIIHKVKTKPVLPTAPIPLSSRIINGQKATHGQFPHQAALYIDDIIFCGGSLISVKWILTAGHCVEGGSEWVAYLGAQNLNLQTEEGRVVSTSRSGILHEGYDSETLSDDIGLVQLQSEISLSEYIQTVNLPSTSDVGNTFEGDTFTVSGWGLTTDGSLDISPQLNFVMLTVISNADCEAVYGPLLPSVMCTDGSRIDNICSGDSGGALVRIEGSTMTEVGIVSFGASTGCEAKYPAGFTRTTAFLDWIGNNTGIQIN